MAIVINGSGTVTGLAVGGLPDGTVDAGTLATNSVDSAELIDGAVDDSHIGTLAASKLTGALPAISAANLTAIPAANITGTLPAISGASLTGLKAGTAGFAARAVAQWNSINTGDFLAFNNDSTGNSFDTDSCYDTSTYKFTAPATGVYMFWFAVYTAQNDASNGFGFKINNTSMNFQSEATNMVSYNDGETADHIQTTTVVVNISSGETVGVVALVSSDYYGGHSQWGGCRLA